MDHAFEISSLVFFVIPMCVISVFYILIGFRLRDSRQIKQSSPGRLGILDRQTRKNQTRVIRMLGKFRKIKNIRIILTYLLKGGPQNIESNFWREKKDEGEVFIFLRKCSRYIYTHIQV